MVEWRHWWGRIWVLLVVVGLPGGCLHKSVLNDSADNVVNCLLYHGPEGDLLIIHESIFQAVSKSSGGGFTRISGYSEGRLSSYDLASGQLSSRLVLGKFSNAATSLLGCTPGHVWVYSDNAQLGLHSLNPRTLAVNLSQEAIKAQNPHLIETLLHPIPSLTLGKLGAQQSTGPNPQQLRYNKRTG